MSDHSSGALTWSTAPGLVILLWIGGALAGVWFTLLTLAHADPAGRVLAVVATIGLLLTALFTTRARPRLRADADGITVRGLIGSRHTPWPLVQRVRVITIRRFGLRRSTLEIDTETADGTEQLVVLSRIDLGAEPEDVLAELGAYRPGR
jgi:hypothetical protein